MRIVHEDVKETWWAEVLAAPAEGCIKAGFLRTPIGGVGINLAIQDAVAAANALSGPLARGEIVDDLLSRVQKRRLLPTRVVQRGQKFIQDQVIGPLLEDGGPITQAPLALRLLQRFPWLRRVPGPVIGLGIKRERVRSPARPH